MPWPKMKSVRALRQIIGKHVVTKILGSISLWKGTL